MHTSGGKLGILSWQERHDTWKWKLIVRVHTDTDIFPLWAIISVKTTVAPVIAWFYRCPCRHGFFFTSSCQMHWNSWQQKKLYWKYVHLATAKGLVVTPTDQLGQSQGLFFQRHCRADIFWNFVPRPFLKMTNPLKTFVLTDVTLPLCATLWGNCGQTL